jgi:CRP/FNR family transcriptional regulator
LTEADLQPEELLSRAPLFARLERRSLKKLAALCVPREYEADTEIISEGDTGLGLFIITGGRVEVSKGEGEDRVQVAVLERGALLGEMALIDDQPRSASATAVEPTRCLLITRGSFQTLVKKDPEIAWCIVPTLADRVRELLRLIEEGGLVESAEVHEDDDTGETRKKRKKRKREDDDEGLSLDRFITGLLRGQYALTIAGFAAFRGVARAAEEFLRRLASETELDDSDRPSELVRRLPQGIIAATGAGIREAEKTPERLLEKYRRYRDGRESS